MRYSFPRRRFDMITLDEARTAIITDIRPATDTEIVPLESAHWRFLAEDARARLDNPLFDNSAMDGYAIHVADLRSQHLALPLNGESRCGDPPATLVPHSTRRIFTGAPLPTGADAVVIQEQVGVEGANIIFPDAVRPGQNIRRQGEDFCRGDVLYRTGRRLSPFDLALMSTAGIAEVAVFRRPRAMVVATGDELVKRGTTLKPGQIYESNRLATLLQLQDLGVVTRDGGIASDDMQALRSVFEQARDYDFIITSGGASVGDHDLVKRVVSEIGQIKFWNVKIKPGKPVAFGYLGGHTHFFALPGNPVSSLVTFKLLVEPAIRAWYHASPTYLELRAIAANDFRRSAGRAEFLRARLFTDNGELMARALRGQGSHMIGTLRDTNGFIKVDANSTGFNKGDVVVTLPLTVDFS